MDLINQFNRDSALFATFTRVRLVTRQLTVFGIAGNQNPDS